MAIGEKKYVKIDDNGNNVEMWVYYEEGGSYLLASGGGERGIYILARPVKKGENFIESTAGKGFKYCMKKLKRRSKKEFEFAEAWLEKNYQTIGESFRDDFMHKKDDSKMWKPILNYENDML